MSHLHFEYDEENNSFIFKSEDITFSTKFLLDNELSYGDFLNLSMGKRCVIYTPDFRIISNGRSVRFENGDYIVSRPFSKCEGALKDLLNTDYMKREKVFYDAFLSPCAYCNMKGDDVIYDGGEWINICNSCRDREACMGCGQLIGGGICSGCRMDA